MKGPSALLADTVACRCEVYPREHPHDSKRRYICRKKKIQFGFHDKKIEISVKKFSGIGNFTSGLMFLSRKKAKALLFEFKKPERFSITSLFVFFPFIALWLDDKNNVIEMKIVKPFTWHIPSRKPYCRLLEIPFNDKYKDILEILVGGKHLKRI